MPRRLATAMVAVVLASALLVGLLLVGPSTPAAAQAGPTATATTAATTAATTRTAAPTVATTRTIAPTAAITRTAAPAVAATSTIIPTAAITRTATPTAAITRTATPTPAATSTTVATATPDVVTSTQTLTLSAARTIIAAAQAEAARLGLPVTIAIVDASGDLLLLEREDNVFPASIDLARGKARTAARFRLATSEIADAIANGQLAPLPDETIVTVAGGLPISVDGRVVGAIGVAGSPATAQDVQIANAGITALAP